MMLMVVVGMRMRNGGDVDGGSGDEDVEWW